MPDHAAIPPLVPPSSRCPSALEELDEAERKEYWAALALRWTKNLSSLDTAKLLRHFGSAYAAIQDIPHWPDAEVSSHKAENFLNDSWREKPAPNG